MATTPLNKIPKMNKFKRGQSVYHATADSRRGIVLDAIYKLSTGSWEYLVAFEHSVPALWYEEFELQTHRIFN